MDRTSIFGNKVTGKVWKQNGKVSQIPPMKWKQWEKLLSTFGKMDKKTGVLDKKVDNKNYHLKFFAKNRSGHSIP